MRRHRAGADSGRGRGLNVGSPHQTDEARTSRLARSLGERYGLTDTETRAWLAWRTTAPAAEGLSVTEPGAHLPPLAEILDYLAATDVEAWWAGPTFRSPAEPGRPIRHCVLSHIHHRWGPRAAMEFEERYSTSYVIGAVNDAPSSRYPQAEPRDRVVAYLQALREGDEASTYESMEVDYLLSCRPDPSTTT